MTYKCCMECTVDRKPGCHDHCERYLKIKAKYDEEKHKTRVDDTLRLYVGTKKAERMDKFAKKKK